MAMPSSLRSRIMPPVTPSKLANAGVLTLWRSEWRLSIARLWFTAGLYFLLAGLMGGWPIAAAITIMMSATHVNEKCTRRYVPFPIYLWISSRGGKLIAQLWRTQTIEATKKDPTMWFHSGISYHRPESPLTIRRVPAILFRGAKCQLRLISLVITGREADSVISARPACSCNVILVAALAS